MIEPPMDFLVLMPNLIHLLIVVILISQRRPHMVFRQLLTDVNTRTTSKTPPQEKGVF